MRQPLWVGRLGDERLCWDLTYLEIAWNGWSEGKRIDLTLVRKLDDHVRGVLRDLRTGRTAPGVGRRKVKELTRRYERLWDRHCVVACPVCSSRVVKDRIGKPPRSATPEKPALLWICDACLGASTGRLRGAPKALHDAAAVQMLSIDGKRRRLARRRVPSGGAKSNGKQLVWCSVCGRESLAVV